VCGSDASGWLAGWLAVPGACGAVQCSGRRRRGVGKTGPLATQGPWQKTGPLHNGMCRVSMQLAKLTCDVVELHAAQALLGRLPPLLLPVRDVPAQRTARRGGKGGGSRISRMREPTTEDAKIRWECPANRAVHSCGAVLCCACAALSASHKNNSPLVCEGHHALVAAAAHHRLLGLCSTARTAGAAGAAVGALHIAGVQQAGWAALVW
jgi:hypothetical protein